jgi:hypothetical protein
MSHEFDYAVAGSTPLSGLLAGILARDYGARVCRIGTFLHEMRPQRGFDISSGAITRPETWRLLKNTIPETLKHLNSISSTRLYERTDSMMLSISREGADALAYMRDAAHGYEFEVERLAVSDKYLAAYAHRNCMRVLRRPLAAVLPDWLTELGVILITPEEARLKVPLKGSVKLRYGDETAEVKKLILAGDSAIVTHGNKRDMQPHFDTVPMSALLMQPTGKLEAPIVQAVDAGLTIYQRGTGALDCAGLGDEEEIGQIARAYLSPNDRLRLAGSAVFNSLLSRDGGPVVGAKSQESVIYVGGLGVSGLFQTPAIARVIAGRAEGFEADYFAARAPGNGGKARNVSEFIAPRLKKAIA